jgi:YggT family protein
VRRGRHAAGIGDCGEAMISLALLIYKILDIYSWIIIASAILSWLVAFGVINMRNQFIRVVVDFLYRITEPVLRPIRRVLPNLGGIDISPVIALLLIIFVQHLIREYVIGF